SLKYSWELTIYFAFYVFPFINGLFTDLRFVTHFLRRFTELGRVNRAVQAFVTEDYPWKKVRSLAPGEPGFFAFTEIGPLREAERTFYKVGVGAAAARQIIDDQLANVLQLARLIAAHGASRVLGDPGILWNRAYVEDLDVAALQFDVDEMRTRQL